MLASFVVHMWSMLTVKFDYGWNMTLCITLGLCQGLAWILWSHLHKHPARCAMIVVYICCLLSFLTNMVKEKQSQITNKVSTL